MAVLARRMLDGLSDDAQRELRDTLTDLSNSGHAELVQVFDALLAGKDMVAALGLPAETASLLYAQAYARFNNGKLAEATTLFQALTVLAPSAKDHWLGLGVCLRLSDALPSARLAFLTAQEIESDCPAVTYHLAELALAQDDLAEAGHLIQTFADLPDTALKQRMLPEARRLATAITARGTHDGT